MLSQEPNLCSAEKPRRSQSSLCVITTERIYTIGFNAPQNPNLAFAFLCIFFLPTLRSLAPVVIIHLPSKQGTLHKMLFKCILYAEQSPARGLIPNLKALQKT
jgi:hypothetical protein